MKVQNRRIKSLWDNTTVIKFDFLVINNLDIIKLCCKMIEENHGIKLDPYKIPDGDKKAYELMHLGVLAGFFQMETSGSAKKLLADIKPESWGEISIVSALNRPGPLENGFDQDYITNKANGFPPGDLPSEVTEITKDTYWTIVYQETVMRIVAEIGGFNLKESDDIRRSMGKKKQEVLDAYYEKFMSGALKRTTMDTKQIQTLWNSLIEFSKYGFNKSHSLSYSIVTYICAYLKAHYPHEFFAALMTVRSQTMSPKDWAQKAPQYVDDAKHFGIKVFGPTIQKSGIGFTIREEDVYFGLNAIKGVGTGSAQSIIRARGQAEFKDIWDFMGRVNLSKVNTKHFTCMVHAGAFDRMGYIRAQLIAQTKNIYTYYKSIAEIKQRAADSKARSEENLAKDAVKANIVRRLKEAKEQVRALKKENKPIPEYIQHIIERDKRLREFRTLAKEVHATENGSMTDVLNSEQLKEYEESLWLRKKPELKLLEEIEKPPLQRVKEITLSVNQLMKQAEHIGCYLGRHPARVLFPNTAPIASVEDGYYAEVVGVVMECKQIITRKGKDMCFVKFGDGTAIAEAVVFPDMFQKLKARKTIPEEGDLAMFRGKIEADDASTKIIVKEIEISRRNE